MVIFLDESGDLGWSFGAPYRKGGSSRHLTISAVCVSENDQCLLGRLVRNLYKKYGWNPKVEKKWTYMTQVEKQYFTKCALNLVANNQSVKYFSITAYKPRVQDHIKKDPNKLYNYLIKQLLLDREGREVKPLG